ncbi:hypothetical protein PAPYR_1536 [Paratrimastix pyriformis]|uniref:SCP domain-containing protein n=1 Tax=Paratrimastix pyriformis TaxID=342808 RepID=A0ABQ8UTW3_9EUKA|nr:hypothetical protein PAPYR_1536 [Paratrimastix pyriformis]
MRFIVIAIFAFFALAVCQDPWELKSEVIRSHQGWATHLDNVVQWVNQNLTSPAAQLQDIACTTTINSNEALCIVWYKTYTDQSKMPQFKNKPSLQWSISRSNQAWTDIASAATPIMTEKERMGTYAGVSVMGADARNLLGDGIVVIFHWDQQRQPK